VNNQQKKEEEEENNLNSSMYYANIIPRAEESVSFFNPFKIKPA
jgi:hypothetical protein